MSSKEKDILQKAIKAQDNKKAKKKNSKGSRSSSKSKSTFDVDGILKRLVDYQKKSNDQQQDLSSRNNNQSKQDSSKISKLGYLNQHNLKKNNKKKKAKLEGKKAAKRKHKSRKAKSKGHSKTNRSLVNKDDITGFSQNYTDLRFGAAIDADNTEESSPVKALGKNIGSIQLKVYDVPKQEKLYLDHRIKQSKLQAIKNQESKEIKKLQNTKHSNKSSVTNKYYVPIYKRVDTELEKRKARLQKLTEQVLQEREVKDKFVSDQLFFPRTRMSYEVQNKHFYGTEKSIDADEEANKNLDDANHHKHRLSNKQMFANFMQDHQTWEMKKKRKIDKKLEEKETKIRSELTFTPRINQHSQKLASKRQGRVESRLLSVGCRTDERIKQIQNCQVLPFKPMIYDNQKKSR